ncbi:hypothetical protein LLS1_24320 [Leifsonia sp. LS1]|uniref:WXG100 family type VII secretion target n=1 Tax=Leifsonia sp. LS1 TaxID=2828483 RepID=UPI001CFD293D|nr:WXG100 family type VII secretion target [Leifsonia sp. LS1]GIT80763.1 hypothetical protein LLS1_24320 [Leifsonia sp. LS1]
MSNNTIRIDTAAMRSVNADMASQNERITGLLSALQSRVEAEMSGWSGSAKSQYEQKKEQWNRAAAEMNRILELLASSTATIASNYEEAESANARMWR